MHLRILNWRESSVGKALVSQHKDLSVIPAPRINTNLRNNNDRLFIDDADAEHKHQT